MMEIFQSWPVALSQNAFLSRNGLRLSRNQEPCPKMGRGCPEIIHLSGNVPGLSQNGPVCPKMQAADHLLTDRLPRSIGEIAVRPIGNFLLPIGLARTYFGGNRACDHARGVTQ